MEAAVALGGSVSPASVAALTEALNDKSEVVRLSAQRSLQEAIQARDRRHENSPSVCTMDVISHILLAQHSRGESFREGFRSRGTTGHDDVLLGLLIVAALVAGHVGRFAAGKPAAAARDTTAPWRLFWALCKAHGLNWSESWLLCRVARAQGLRDPGRLFLEAQRWEEKNLGPRFALEYPRLQVLRNRIFGSAEPDAAAEPATACAASAAPLPRRRCFPACPAHARCPPWTADGEC